MSTAVGYAAADPQRQHVLVIGDLSFFYDMNALWNVNLPKNLRIVLLNNSGGAIFHGLPGLELGHDGHRFVSAEHKTDAQAWVESRGFTYQAVHTDDEWAAVSEHLFDDTDAPLCVEIFTDKDEDVKAYKEAL